MRNLLRRSGCAAVAACAWLALAPALWAQARTALSWVREPGAESCIAAPELGRKVERMVGPVLASAPEGEVSIEGRIARAGARFEATVVITDASGTILGQRELRSAGADCRLLDDQLAFVIAVAIDPDAALAQLPGEFADEGEPGEALLAELRANPPKSAPRPRPRSAPAPARADAPVGPPEPGAALRVAVGPAAGIGIVGAPGAGVGAELGFVLGRWMHQVRGAYWLPQTEPIPRSYGVELGLWQLSLESCPELWGQAGWELRLCAGAVAARLSAEPRGFAGKRHDRWLFGPSLGARLGRRLSGALSAVLAAGAQSLWPRHRVVYKRGEGTPEVHTVPPLMASATLALELRF